MRRPRTIQLISLALGGLGLLVPRGAWAQNPAAAEALFEQARTAMAAGSYDIACARFRDSDKLDPAVGTRFNLADCEEKRGRLATAWSLFRGVLSELAQDDDRRPIAQQRVKALEPRMAYLTLTRTPETPPGASVRIDGVQLGEASFGVSLPMDPGAHDLSLLLAPGGQEQTRTFMLSEGEHKDLPIDSTASALLPAPDESQIVASSGDSQRKWAYVAGGVGAFGIVFGTVTGIVALSKKSTATASVVGFGVGVVGLATGAYLWLTAPKAQEVGPGPHRQTRVRPELGLAPGAGFLSVEGSF